jgi:hypothetical protein
LVVQKTGSTRGEGAAIIRSALRLKQETAEKDYAENNEDGYDDDLNETHVFLLDLAKVLMTKF